MKMLKKSSVSFALLLAAGQLYAQPTKPTPPAPPAAPVADSPPTIQLSGAEMSRRTVELEGQVRVDLQHVEYLQATERKKQDVIKLSCVNDKFVKLKAEANLFDIARNELNVSINGDGRFAAFPHVVESADRAHKVRNEADQCAGELELLRETTSNGSYTHPVIPDDPTVSVPFEGITLVEDPGYASPFD